MCPTVVAVILPQAALYNGRGTGKKLIPIFPQEHEIAIRASVTISYLARAARPYFDELEPVYGRCVIGKRDVSIVQSHDMVGRVPDIDIL
jgi:hypothetical protein